jgi:putative ABC transport system substrate-binding protein
MSGIAPISGIMTDHFLYRRRTFLTMLGAAAGAWPLAARAQQRRRLPTIGFLGASTPSLQSQWTAAFLQRLRELGWIEGRTIAIEFRWGEGRPERFAAAMAEFLRLKVDVIVTHGSSAIGAAKRATSVVPIVFPVDSNPVENGFAASLARPGGNITGLSLQRSDTVGKRIELLREIVPGLRRVALLVNPRSPGAVLEASEVQTTIRGLGLESVKSEISRAEDIAPAFTTFRGGVEAVYVAAEPLVFINRLRISTLALDTKLPTIYGVREYVDAGGLISYGPNFADLFRRSADYVDKILRGAKPADIPIEQPTKFDLVVNLITAKSLGVDIPTMVLARADEVIE